MRLKSDGGSPEGGHHRLKEKQVVSGFSRTVPAVAAAMLVPLFLCSSDARAASRRVTIRTDDGVMLAGSYHDPSRRPAPGIVLLHMLGRTHDDWESTASRLADAGFAVIAIDFRGHGGSGTAPSDGQGAALSSMELDIKAAKTFLRERPEVLATTLGIAGASIGANLSVLDAADDANVKSIALLSPGLDYRGLKIEAAMKKLGERPALLVSSTKDPYSWRSVRQLALIGPGTREVRLSDSIAHGTVLLSKDNDLIAALVDWFRRTLV